MKVAFKKSTNEPINDFQSLATEEGLISNAIKTGISEKDIEVRELTEEEYYQKEEEVNGTERELNHELSLASMESIAAEEEGALDVS